MNDLFSPKTIISFALGAVLFGTHFVIGFTEPTAAPPSNNVPAPLHTGSGGQSKAGGLILNTGGAATGLIVDKGNVGIGIAGPTEKLEVNGNIKATAFFYTSDGSLKTDIRPIYNALEKIKNTQGVSFTWAHSGVRSLGFIAQDMEKVFPEIVSTDKTAGLKSVQYGNLTAPIIEAVKELDAKSQYQQQRITDLGKQIQELREEISKLKK